MLISLDLGTDITPEETPGLIRHLAQEGLQPAGVDEREEDGACGQVILEATTWPTGRGPRCTYRSRMR